MKSRKQNHILESLPPHLAKLLGPDGDWAPEAKARLGKDGVGRLTTTKRKPKDVTPKGYGPIDEGVNDFVQVSNRDFHNLERYGAVFNGSTGGLYFKNRLVGYRDHAVQGGRLYFLDPEFAPKTEVTEGRFTDGEYRSNPTTTYMIKDRMGSEWATLEYPDHPGSNNYHLRKLLTDLANKLGWDGNYEVVAQWQGDLDKTLADAQEKLNSGKQFIRSYEIELNNRVRDLSKAKAYMAKNPQAQPAQNEARDLDTVIGDFLHKRKMSESEPTDSDYAIGMAQAKKSTGDRPPLKKSTVKKAHKIARAVAKNESSYNPGVTKLTRAITLEPDEIARVKQAVQGVTGIEMKVRGDQVMFRTAKIKTLAKLLDKHVDFGATDVGTVLDIPAEIGPIYEKDSDPCWDNYRQLGMKKKNGREVPNCVPESDVTKAGTVLGRGMSSADRAADIDQSDREYIKQMEFKRKWKSKNPGKPWPGYRAAGMGKLDEGMPSSVIKHKQKYANMSDSELAAKLGGKSEQELRQMAWRHGYGKMSDHYVRRVAKGKTNENVVAEKEGGMSDAERKAYNRKHGSNLKRAQPSGGKRRTSYCARSKGQMDQHNIDCRKDPDKPICKARRDWNC